jgi:hypothetical protein
MSTIEELIERKSSGSGLENRDYGRKGLTTDYATNLYPQKLALTSPTSDGVSVRIVRSRTKATQLFDGVRLVNFATFKNLRVKNTMFPHSKAINRLCLEISRW